MDNIDQNNEVLMRFGADLLHFDAHMHLPWIEDKKKFCEELSSRQMKVFACTTEPDEYLSCQKEDLDDKSIFVGLGLHPWFLDEPRINKFTEIAGTSMFIGEIGLDFKSKKASDKQLQISAFKEVCDSVLPGSIISIHSASTNGKTHEILKNSGRLHDCLCIYHWFSDDAKTLARAIDDGCYFSVNRKMILSKRGKGYIGAIPKERLLIETDRPSFDGDSYSFLDFGFMAQWLSNKKFDL